VREEKSAFFGFAVPGVIPNGAAVGRESQEPCRVVVRAVDQDEIAVIELGDLVEVRLDGGIDHGPPGAPGRKGDGLNDVSSMADDDVAGVDLRRCGDDLFDVGCDATFDDAGGVAAYRGDERGCLAVGSEVAKV
jgi:hypothetical protein